VGVLARLPQLQLQFTAVVTPGRVGYLRFENPAQTLLRGPGLLEELSDLAVRAGHRHVMHPLE
jgi:hypothetical protein